MRSKSIIALSTALFLVGGSSLALAGGRDDADSSGGYAVSPQGQLLGTPHESGRNAYGFVPAAHSKQPVQKKSGKVEGRNAFGSAPSHAGTDANIAIQDQLFNRTLGN
jgi:hypothetical protein